MQFQSDYLITPEYKRKTALLFVGAFVFGFLFLLGLTLSVITIAPAVIPLATSLFSRPEAVVAQLPLSADRVVPFSTPNPNIIINPYPVQVPLVPTYNPAEASSGWIRIPKIGVNVPIALSPTMNDDDILATLNKGAALYPNGIGPGALGNVFISAHSTGEPWKGAYRFAFIKINELAPGDMVYVDWRGARYAYKITSSETITPTPDFRVISDRPIPTLSIMACWPLWSTSHRMLVHSELTNITQLTRPAA